MNNFTFRSTAIDLDTLENKSEVELSFSATTLSEVLEEFENFLLGCGYRFEGSLDIVSPDEYIKEEE